MPLLHITPHKPVPLIWWWKNRDSIDFEPPYQRKGRLWSPKDKAYLIDTLINGFDVPKLYLADFQFGMSKLNVSKKTYSVIDGKQRLEAIFEFLDNKLPLNEDFIYRDNNNIKLAGLTIRDIRNAYPDIADKLESEPLPVMSVVAEREEDVHEIFLRLNRSKPLTGAEIRNAMGGPVPELIRTLASHDFFAENTKFSVKRAADLNAAAKLLLFEYKERPVATKKIDLDQFVGEDHTRQLELASRRVVDTLNVLKDVFIPNDPLLSSAGILPVYYWFIKQIQPEEVSRVREFLVWYENARAQNRVRQRVDSADRHVDPNLSRFDTLNRSTNDEQSHLGRIELLYDAFARWNEFSAAA